MKIFLIALLLNCTVPCSYGQQDTIFKACLDYKMFTDRVETDSPFPTCGYVDRKGKAVIPVGKYEACFNEEFVHYAFVKIPDGDIIGINRNGKKLFYPFWFDNWPDEPNEGLFRITDKEGKVGYADITGKIVIKPVYSWGNVFVDGKAKVTFKHRQVPLDDEHFTIESDEWITIDKTGKVIPDSDKK